MNAFREDTDLLTLPLNFTIQLEQPRKRLGFLGATLRGGLGFVLRDLYCKHVPDSQGRCSDPEHCAYGTLFEGVKASEQLHRAGADRLPQPMVMNVESPNAWRGELNEVRFGISLFGCATQFAPQLINAIQELAKRGLGPDRELGKLSNIDDSNIEGFNQPKLLEANPAPKHACSLKWSFHTPLDIRKSGVSLNRIGAIDLLLSGRRRWELLCQAYGGNNYEADIGERLEASQFRVMGDQTSVWKFERYSARQDSRMEMRGIVGDVTIHGPWHQAGAWLKYVHCIGLGKHASFGFGRTTWQQRVAIAEQANTSHTRIPHG